MGIFNKLFNKKDNTKISTEVTINVNKDVKTANVAEEVQDVILVYLAEKYKIDEKQYPDYFRYKYGIGFPSERFSKLNNVGYICVGNVKSTLSHLTLPELKEIASKYEIKTSGKKDELLNRIIENVSDADLSKDVKDRYWEITDSGKELLKNYSYIEFFMEKHPYYLENIGLDLNGFSRLFYGKSNARVRDTLWGEFNKKSSEYYLEGMKKGSFTNYCNLLQIMALFLEEEEKHKSAILQYMKYIYYRANFDAGLKALNNYNIFKNVDEAANSLFLSAQIYPFIAKELTTISDGCGFNSTQLKEYMISAFSNEKDTGLFSPNDLAEFVMCGLNGDQEGQKNICKSAIKAGIKCRKKK